MGFINRNLVALVMIPSIIGLHYGWSELQGNTNLVPDGTRIEQPIYSVRDYNIFLGVRTTN